MHRIIYPDGVRPAPPPSYEAAWEGVLVVTGGLEDPTATDVLTHWMSQGVPHGDACELFNNAQPNVIFTVQTLFAFGGTENAQRYALTERAARDARTARYS